MVNAEGRIFQLHFDRLAGVRDCPDILWEVPPSLKAEQAFKVCAREFVVVDADEEGFHGGQGARFKWADSGLPRG